MQRHDLDPLSLIAGVMFVIIGGGYALSRTTDTHLHWLVAVPIGLLCLGVSVVVLAIRRITAGDARHQAAAIDDES